MIMEKLDSEKIKNIILKKYKSILEFSKNNGLNYQMTTDTIRGARNNLAVAEALFREFKIQPGQLPNPPREFKEIEKFK